MRKGGWDRLIKTERMERWVKMDRRIVGRKREGGRGSKGRREGEREG